jgi:lysozyme
MSGDEKKPEAKAESKPSPAATPTPPAPTPAAESAPSTQVPGTGIKPGADSGMGIKPGKGGLGIKAEQAPVMTGEDKPIMEMIKKHEGVRTRPYKDSLGLWTVGVGRLIGDGKSLPPEMNREFSMAEVDAMFAEDYKHHKEAAQKIPGFEKLNATGKAALIDLTFNMGPAWYKRWPNFSKALAGGDTEGAAKSLEDSKWYTQVGNRARTIVSMIRGGGSNSGTVIASSTPSATQEKTTPMTGEKVATASMAVEAAGTGGKPTVINNNLEGSKIAQRKGAPQAPMSIPAPIANRGSLDSGTKYSSAYAS